MGPTMKLLKILEDTPAWKWPEETAEALLEVLNDRGAGEEERLLAAALAGDMVVIDDALADALLAILRSGEEPERTRARAAISLGPVLELCDSDGFDEPDDTAITELTFREIQETLRKLYPDAGIPKVVRRRILEAAVRAPLDWHQDAARAAFASDDEEWRLTAVFCMRFVQGFDEQILASLDSENPAIHAEAVLAAGSWGLQAAKPHVLGLVHGRNTEKRLLLAAIEAVGGICPEDAPEELADLEDSDDPEISEAVAEATSFARLGDEDPEGDDDPEDEDPDDEGPRTLH